MRHLIIEASNADGYTNSIYTITVGALDRNDGHPVYSEACSAVMIVMYSSSGVNADAIVSPLPRYNLAHMNAKS